MEWRMEQMIRKAFDGRTVELQAGRREIVACISTGALDRQNEVVLPQGLVRKNYAGMTVFYDHNTALPVGAAQWVKQQDGRIVSKFRCTDKTAFARDIFALAQDGILNSYSIGFMPLEASAPTAAEIARHPEWEAARCIYRKWELLEFSIVGIAANPQATMLAISKKLSPESLRLLGLRGAAEGPPTGLQAAPAAADADSAASTAPTAGEIAACTGGRRLLPAEIIKLAAAHWLNADARGLVDAAIYRAFARRAGRIE